MSNRINEIQGRLNLYRDDFYEDFRDVLTDHATDEMYALQKPGTTCNFGNDCSLEMLTNEAIDIEHHHEFVSGIIEPWGWDPSEVQLIHSHLHLNMQAQVEIKIDIIWSVEALDDPDQPFEYSSLAVFFEDNGQGAFDDGPNFDPMNNSNWAEFIHDMGIGLDPFGGLDD
jgi:hypothetical protein